jgi:ribose 5-phosphate isomerase A
MSQVEGKRRSGDKAAEYVTDGSVVGVGTGSTVAFFIEALGRMKSRIEGAVSSSEQSTRLLKELGIPVLDLNATGPLDLYVDGADECDRHNRLIKGGGGALTREKIIADASKQFVCIIDASKEVELLGAFPVTASRSGAKAWSPTTATGSSTSTTGASPIRSRWRRS